MIHPGGRNCTQCTRDVAGAGGDVRHVTLYAGRLEVLEMICYALPHILKAVESWLGFGLSKFPLLIVFPVEVNHQTGKLCSHFAQIE